MAILNVVCTYVADAVEQSRLIMPCRHGGYDSDSGVWRGVAWLSVAVRGSQGARGELMSFKEASQLLFKRQEEDVKNKNYNLLHILIFQGN